VQEDPGGVVVVDISVAFLSSRKGCNITNTKKQTCTYTHMHTQGGLTSLIFGVGESRGRDMPQVGGLTNRASIKLSVAC
jgi:hypothetical protein